MTKTAPPQHDAQSQSRANSTDSTSQSATNGNSRRPSQDSSYHLYTDNQDPQTRNAAKRAAHNVIEKRYRSNMNAKFISLEKSVSSTSIQKHSSKGGAGALKKSEILTNALVYIENMQHENQALRKELGLLKQNLLPGGLWRHPEQL